MGSFGDYLENKLLDHVFGATTYTPPAIVYMGLFTSTPSDSGGGTEVTGNNYVRLAITNNTTNFSSASSGSKTNATDFTFGMATGSWGTITSVAFFDAVSSGNLIGWGAVSANKTVSSGDTVNFAASQITITLD